MQTRLWILCALGLAACSGSGQQGGAQSAVTNQGDDTQGDGDTASDPMCSATFHWLQKDAYANRAGRTTTLWPPHTTTTIDVTCDDGTTLSAFRENHGTKPSEVDANGTPILVDVKDSDPVRAPLSIVQNLLQAYAACECAPTTTFLTTDAVSDANAQQLLAALATYVQANMSCGGVDVATVVSWLQSGDIDDVLDALPSCTWNDGDDWGTGFDAAAKSVLGATWSSYHVCNNDAQLESTLWQRFAAGDSIEACDSDSATCHGSVFFYNP